MKSFDRTDDLMKREMRFSNEYHDVIRMLSE